MSRTNAELTFIEKFKLCKLSFTCLYFKRREEGDIYGEKVVSYHRVCNDRIAIYSRLHGRPAEYIVTDANAHADTYLNAHATR